MRARRHLHPRAVGDRHGAVGIRGKALGLPVAKLLGGFATGSCLRQRRPDAHAVLEEVVTAAGRLVERGWQAMKTQLALPGGTRPEVEVERIRRIREAIGPEIRLMCDINQRWTVPEAISIGERLEPYRLHWLEDVTTRDDYAGLARVAARLATPIAGGEYVYGIAPFRHMLEARSVDYRHDRPGARRRHHPVDEGRRHGRGLQPAGGLAPDPGGPRAPDRRHPQRAHRRVHALDARRCSPTRRCR